MEKNELNKLDAGKEWFLFIQGQKEGPYDIGELKHDHRITPDTLVWKKGFQEWIPARFVFELNVLFQDEEQSEIVDQEGAKNDYIKPEIPENPETLALSQDPQQLYLWLLLCLLLIYIFFQFSGK